MGQVETDAFFLQASPNSFVLHHTPEKEGGSLKSHISDRDDSELALDALNNHDRTDVQKTELDPQNLQSKGVYMSSDGRLLGSPTCLPSLTVAFVQAASPGAGTLS